MHEGVPGWIHVSRSDNIGETAFNLFRNMSLAYIELSGIVIH